MKRKKKDIKILNPLSELLMNNLESDFYSRKFKMFLNGEKDCIGMRLLKHIYEFELDLDWSEVVYCKYIDDLERVRFIFYSLMDEIRSPITAFEMNLNLKEYLDLIERIFDNTKNISTGN